MFPFQRGNELVIQFSNNPNNPQQINKISGKDLILPQHDSAYLDFNESDQKFSINHPKKKLFYGTTSSAEKGNSAPNNEPKKKKMLLHREIERQRRQEMASCYASLRSLLPLDFIKGKRSICDHMNEAVNYIKHMENNIKELSAKRDELKKLSDSRKEIDQSMSTPAGNFSVHENNGIVGIEITSGFREKRFKLSMLLQLLHEEGLEVSSCVSTQVNGRLIHSVQCEVNNSNGVDVSELRRKVCSLIPTFGCSD